MRRMARYSLLLTALGAEIVLGSVAACGSTTQNGADAGIEAAADGARTDVRRPPDGSGSRDGEAGASHDGGADAPASPGALALCQADFGAAAACGTFSAACIAEIGGDGGLSEKLAGACAAEWAMFGSDGYLQALATCISQLPHEPSGCCLFHPEDGGCADATVGFAESVLLPCVTMGLSKVKPDPAGEKLEADFCKTCPTKGSGINPCAGFFDVQEAGLPDGGIDAGSLNPFLNSLGFGSFALEYPDAVVNLVDEQCTGPALASFDAGVGPPDAGALGCYVRFAECAEVTYQTYVKGHVPSTGIIDASAYAACLPEATGGG